MTSRPALMLRGVARRMKWHPKTINRLMGNRKEEAFARHLFAAARSGDVAWDIGAFQGWYTVPLSEAVGPNGHVFSFEPNAANRARIDEKAADRPNTTVLPIALGNACGAVNFVERGAHSRVVADDDAADVAAVRMATGDSLIESGEAAQPSVLKIDAEGLEYDLLKGLGGALGAPCLRAIVMEIHFRLLQERHATDDIPAKIVALLRSHGFRTRWIGASHLLAQRDGGGASRPN
jgi:FkbM family methyltransferase